MNTHITHFLFGIIIATITAMLFFFFPMPASSAPTRYYISVTTTADEYDTSGSGTGCSLREAIHLNNMGGVNFGGCVSTFFFGIGYTTIYVPAGIYTLTLPGAGEDADATGDLDILSNMIISATGAVTVTGNTGWNDRIFDIVTGTVTIKGLTVSGGSEYVGGGVQINSGTSLTLNDSQITGNHATYGGGIYNNQGTLILDNMTLSGNTASNSGGGIYTPGGLASLTNVTLSSNVANCGFLCFGFGGGIYITGTAKLNLTNVTLSGNGGGFGNGIYKVNGTVALTNTILANGSENCNGVSGGSFNLSNDNTCGFGAGRDNINVMLGPLANNGGSTLTHMLLPGSPAINFGTNAGCPASDQRGALRPIGSVCDVGAVEASYIFLPLILR